MRLIRWGHWGTPVLVFPPAAGDEEEIEREGLLGALWPLVEAGRIKVYSVDAVAARGWLMERAEPEQCAALQNRYDGFVYHEVIPAIRADCLSDGIEVITAGAAIGAFNALAALCRHPDAVRAAIGLSGTYDLEPWMEGVFSLDFYFASPSHFLPNLNNSWQLDLLRRRFALFAFGQGRSEDPDESWRMAHLLGEKGVPNRVDPWGPKWDHGWPTWQRMLPRYLAELA